MLAASAALVLLVLGAVAFAAPVVRSGSAVTATVVDCGGTLDCWLARQLVPGAWLAPRKTVIVDGVAEGAQIGAWSAGTIASGERGGDTLPADAIRLESKPKVMAGTAVVPIAFSLEGLSPDRYHGVVRLGGGDLTPAEIPLELSVRSGPSGPLLWLVAGVVIGLMLKFWRERGQRMAKTATEIDRITAIVGASDAADRQVLEPMLAEAREAMYRGQLDAADAALASIDARRGMLSALGRLLGALPGKRAEIERIRSMVARRRDEQATANIAVLEELADAGGGGASERLVRGAAPGRRDLGVALGSALGSRPRRLWLWIVEHVMGRALRGVTIAAAVVLGLKVMYVDGGATYGASAFFDGVALFLWGLGAEISSRTFSELGRRLTPALAIPVGAPAAEDRSAAVEKTLSVPPDVEIHEPAVQPKALARGPGWPHDALELDELSRRGLEGHGVTSEGSNQEK